jgi:phospholipase C
MFLITYDEHGGFYDHVAPPGTRRSTARMTVPPLHAAGPSFYGPRVPAVVVSPWVKAGSVESTVFDHTSIAKTILLRFLRRSPSRLGDLGPLSPAMRSRRLLHAAHLGRVLTMDRPRRGLAPIAAATCPPPRAGSRRAAPTTPRPDDFHEGMRRLARPAFSRR